MAKNKWHRPFLIVGIILLIMVFIANQAYPTSPSYRTGEYTEIYEGAGAVPEYERGLSPSSNPDWVRGFQNNHFAVFFGSIILIVVGASILVKVRRWD